MWLKTYNKYKPISPEDTLKVTTRQKRLIKISLVCSCITILFLLAHFIVKSTEDYIEQELQDETDEIVKLIENITKYNETSENGNASNYTEAQNVSEIQKNI